MRSSAKTKSTPKLTTQKQLVKSTDLKKFTLFSEPKAKPRAILTKQSSLADIFPSTEDSCPLSVSKIPQSHKKDPSNPFSFNQSLKIPLFDTLSNHPSFQDSHIPASVSSSPSKYQRKDSRSQTELNTPITPVSSNFAEASEAANIPQQQIIRSLSRNKTEIVLPKPHQPSLNNETRINESKKIIGSNAAKMSNNYKIEQTPSRMLQKGKLSQISEDPHEKRYVKSTIETSEGERRMKASLGSNTSLTSFMYSDAQNDIIQDLAKSIKELNQRLIKSEEVTYERLQENLELKSSIINLESKINDQRNHRLETKGVNVSCSKECRVF